MSVNVQIIGRLGADAEVRTSKNGKPFVYFRLATDDFKNGKRETIWVNVIDTTERSIKLVEYLKKGSLINIHGSENVSIYTNKNGEAQISRDVMCDRFDFISTKSTDSNKETTPQTVSEKKTPEIDNDSLTCGSLTNSVVIADDDDLPF